MKSMRRCSAGRLASPMALFAALVVLIYARPLFSHRSFAGRDLLAYHLPVENAIHDAYARGRLPLWYSDISGGRPLLANPNTGSLYPLRPLLALLPFPVAFRIYPVVHWILAGLGMMVLLDAFGASPTAGWLAAVTYAFSGVAVSNVFFTNLQPGMALLPWILWATVAEFSAWEMRLLVLAGLWSLELLGGDAFSILLALAFTLLAIVLEETASARPNRMAIAGGALLLGALFSAPQWMATLLWAPLTERAVVGIPLSEALTFSLSPWRLLEVLIPYPFGATWSLAPEEIWGRHAFRNFFATLYCGSLPLVGYLAAVRQRRRGARFVAASAVTSAALAIVPFFVPASWRTASSPIPLRYPEKFVLGLALSLSIAAGLAWDSWRGEGRWRRVSLAIGAALAATALVSAWQPTAAGRVAADLVGAARSTAGDAGRQLALALAEAGIFWMATVVGLELGRGSAAGVVLLTLVPVAADRRIALTERQDALFRPTPLARAVLRRDPHQAFRSLDESRYRPASALERVTLSTDPLRTDYYRRHLYLNTQSLWGQATVFNSDLDAGDLSQIESLRRLSSLLASQPAGQRLFEALSLRFGSRSADQQPLPGFHPFGGDALTVWDENPRARPSLRLLRSWREVSGAVEALSALARPGAEDVVIETGRGAAGASPGGSVRVLEDSPERLVAVAQAPVSTWLFVLRAYWPYRRVSLDGREVEVFPADLAFSALSVPAGTHRLEWVERAPGIEASAVGTLIAVAAAAWLVGRLIRRRPASETPR